MILIVKNNDNLNYFMGGFITHVTILALEFTTVYFFLKLILYTYCNIYEHVSNKLYFI